jgi:metallo-beta-lactamase class B
MMTCAALLASLLGMAGDPDTTAVKCDACEEWNKPQAAFRIHGDSHFVGVQGLGAVLIETSRGLILIDGGLPQSVPLILSNIQAVGRRVQDVKWILISHPHYDHTGGVAALARMSGARVAASPAAAVVLRAGMVKQDDPQAGFGEAMRFPPVRGKIVELRDGATIRLGNVAVKMHHTPGHTLGGTSWTWRSCDKDRPRDPQGCRNLVYADSLNAVSAPGFRFAADQPRLQQFRRTIDKVKNLPCDILISAHPSFSGIFEKHAARGKATASDPMVDPQACRRYADAASARLEKRLAEERRPVPDAGASATAPTPAAR